MYLHSEEGVKSVTPPPRDSSCHAGTAVKGGMLLVIKLLKFKDMYYYNFVMMMLRTKCDVHYNPVVQCRKQIKRRSKAKLTGDREQKQWNSLDFDLG